MSHAAEYSKQMSTWIWSFDLVLWLVSDSGILTLILCPRFFSSASLCFPCLMAFQFFLPQAKCTPVPAMSLVSAGGTQKGDLVCYFFKRYAYFHSSCPSVSLWEEHGLISLLVQGGWGTQEADPHSICSLDLSSPFHVSINWLLDELLLMDEC